MKMSLGIERIADQDYPRLVRDLEKYSPCTVTREGEGAIVQTEGDVVACECVVAICDKYRFSPN